jgi:hypothetical protein
VLPSKSAFHLLFILPNSSFGWGNIVIFLAKSYKSRCRTNRSESADVRCASFDFMAKSYKGRYRTSTNRSESIGSRPRFRTIFIALYGQELQRQISYIDVHRPAAPNRSLCYTCVCCVIDQPF